MTEPSKTRDTIRLLTKAVESLPEEERQAVYEYLFERAVTGEPTAIFPALARHAAKLRGWSGASGWIEPALSTLFTAQKPGAQQVTIPVRLSEDAHRRLKAWCAEHNFPMSVVVRGLVDRFLDSWEQRAA